MKNFLASACAVAALSLAAPVSAQSGILGDVIQGVFGGSSSRIDNYDDRIRVAYQRGEISEREARDLQNRYFELRQLEQQYRQGGLSRDERYDLQRRVSDFQRRFEMARNNGRYDDDDDDRWSDNNGRRCPPGLAKKRNGCLPPGQVGRDDGRYRDSSGYRDDYRDSDRDGYRDGDRYVWQRDRNGRMVQIDRRTGRVVRVSNR